MRINDHFWDEKKTVSESICITHRSTQYWMLIQDIIFVSTQIPFLLIEIYWISLVSRIVFLDFLSMTSVYSLWYAYTFVAFEKRYWTTWKLASPVIGLIEKKSCLSSTVIVYVWDSHGLFQAACVQDEQVQYDCFYQRSFLRTFCDSLT
jgi:hypothetical protein